MQRGPHDTIAYLTECTLATVDRLVGRKSPPTGELKRQANIAQHGVTALANQAGEFDKAPRLNEIRSKHNGDVTAYVTQQRATWQRIHGQTANLQTGGPG